MTASATHVLSSQAVSSSDTGNTWGATATSLRHRPFRCQFSASGVYLCNELIWSHTELSKFDTMQQLYTLFFFPSSQLNMPIMARLCLDNMLVSTQDVSTSAAALFSPPDVVSFCYFCCVVLGLTLWSIWSWKDALHTVIMWSGDLRDDMNKIW